ncbi:restriction endonuclease subunit S [Chryseobacterium sp. Leaf394]|uniref:restriction endonuclease subunit S n=1 Tax=Chryseobacterium sp. Leaf394 TaxID=1736361 RepID=UPI0007017A11|nr:restriction endonuclease subunit S [Chryseobacterium sp. Leaf394]KQS91924.1 hypothetical protein ASG21_05560 [Chryseobacterium sp. Leaf394]
MQRYEIYKDSGVDWIGEIPEHWKVIKLKYIFKILKRIAGSEGFDVLSITQRGIKIKDVTSGEGQLAMDYAKYQFCYVNDFAMNHMDLLTGWVDLSNFDGVISPDYRVFDLIRNDCSKTYLLILLQLCYTNKVFYAHGQGVSMLGRWRFPSENFNNFYFPIPRIEEQFKIVSFLDDKTAKIDQTIANKQKEIELLKERRQILIQKAVTKGLDDSVKLKDSGVDWIGEIPEHWEVISITKISSRVDYRGKTPEKVENGIFLVTTRNIKKGFINYEVSKEYVTEKDYHNIMSRGLPKIGDILFTMEAPLGESAMVDDENVAIAQRIIKFRFNKKKAIHKFVNYSFASTYFQNKVQSEGTGSTAKGIKASKLGLLKIILPDLKEQTQIVAYLEEIEEKISKAILLKQREIEKLKEYKTVLIDNVVTGKVRVS